ncbi:MAG: hypothetical protein ACD_22C00100G0012 [uncultured bacterium]|nr:MAG: hypothetical protein ACD_22C00100G0012 [uncultured bacterium]
MIYIVHGENYTFSRNIILNQQKKLGNDRTEIDVTQTTPGQLKDLCSSNDLFGTPPFIVLDISNAGRANLDAFVDALSNLSAETNVIVLSSKELTKTNAFLKAADKLGAKVINNQKQITSNIFKFVDTLFLGNRKQIYTEYTKLINDDNDPFYIFSMLLYGVRKNAHKMPKQTLSTLLLNLYNIDKGVKTGELSVDMYIPLSIEKILNAQLQA